LVHELAANVVVADGSPHRVARDRHALDERVRVVAQDFAVVAGTGLAFVGVDDEVLLPRRILGHEAPFEPRREARTTPTAQPGRLHLLDDLVPGELAREHAPPRLVAVMLL